MEKVNDSYFSVCKVQDYTRDKFGRICNYCGNRYLELCPKCSKRELNVDKTGASCGHCGWDSSSVGGGGYFIFNDGGREAAGFKGFTGDCVVRAIAIATEEPYKEVYDSIVATAHKINERKRKKITTSPRYGVNKEVLKEYLTSKGWNWTALMKIGSGCKTHLRKKELPSGKIICSLSKHYVAVIDGIVHDTYDSTRGGKRCVYGYWSKEE